MRLHEINNPKPGKKEKFKLDFSVKNDAVKKLDKELDKLSFKWASEEDDEKARSYMARIEELKAQIEHLKKTPQQEHEAPIITELKTECSEFLAVASRLNLMLFRGMYTGKKSFVGTPRVDRRPLDSSYDFQNQYDTFMASKGFTALRSNSIFCISSPDKAAQYGYVYMIFPKNGFTYTWSQTKADINIDDDEFATYENLNQVFDDLSPSNTNLGEALQMEHEVAINGSYYAIRLTKKTSYLLLRLGINLDLEGWGPDDE